VKKKLKPDRKNATTKSVIRTCLFLLLKEAEQPLVADTNVTVALFKKRKKSIQNLEDPH
jgi:hypothetical protein